LLHYFQNPHFFLTGLPQALSIVSLPQIYHISPPPPPPCIGLPNI
jgi:hypothetical protein